ncbi:cystathionine gamma-synthase [Ochrobactrum sp. POC9]|uniref:c-type cytochrome n=1 Tax=unclassified Ochrobactrum TaxID=239106 RepID=UPI000D706B92|nr:c-type cytochrome [Ochrobactrum sp. POC9]MCH4543589.1 c-type cytochrome [Ochrobactrum sp. A-1]PWU75759.1 cystathionine gamma-synthase [Ochrobactrum sp. POC9]
MRWSDLAAYGVVFCLSLTYFAVTSDSSRSSITPRTNHAIAKNNATVPQNAATSANTGNVSAKTAAAEDAAWEIPDPDTLPDDAWGRIVRHGRDLITETYAHMGPEMADETKRFAGNNLSCQSCHLEAGTKKYGLPLVGVYGDFPQYRSREGQVGTIEDRVNGCMTRSLNGTELAIDSPQMKAMVAYIKYVSAGTIVGENTKGRGSGKMPELKRPADPVHGEKLYAEVCAACHGADGQGKRVGVVGDAKGYEFPPLWGPDSFNDGAGMNRLISAANFIHANMPNGVSLDEPQLEPENAWDIAAFFQSKPRPAKADLDKDFPNRLEKPADAGYGPYADNLSAQTHKVGPFDEIRTEIKKLKAVTN